VPTAGIRRRVHADLSQNPKRISLAGRLDDPREHQIAKYGVALGDRLKRHDAVGGAGAGGGLLQAARHAAPISDNLNRAPSELSHSVPCRRSAAVTSETLRATAFHHGPNQTETVVPI
jgi:hypothetical protein